MNDAKYIAKVIEEIGNSPNSQICLKVGIFEIRSGVEKQVGEYIRNYPNLFRTFHHFRKNDKHLALYAPHYTATRIMELPSCRDIGGEEPSASGFCPTDFYVPLPRTNIAPAEEAYLVTDFGFVAGCHWGDDDTWKIEFLDLSEADKGILKRDDRFGYIELPDNLTLEQAISFRTLSTWDERHSCYRDTVELVRIAVQHIYDLRNGELQ